MKLAAVGIPVMILSLTACVEEAPTAGQPAVGNSGDLSAFEGARAGQSEMGVQALGYKLISTAGLTAYWFNRSAGACARIVTADGRYASVDMVAAGDC
ncbi:hypothetical protein [Thetidibacter halocola]|uniref:Uncharacterized protein n=1 Tax=Thetidibacter halocola TaxID=2827239 RepID=A0A8J7WCB9_9RHOB|nr:hypothetical protein [Thetidibacter halocola]MBS0125005.1 hypothetical protein [Thetidibacter halocola]